MNLPFERLEMRSETYFVDLLGQRAYVERPLPHRLVLRDC